MKEKFIYPLLAILLTVISTNVSGATTQKTAVFSWRGDIPIIDALFDWDFVDQFNNQYTPATGILTPSFNETKSMKLLGTPIQFFIAPKYYDGQTTGSNILNEVEAKLDGRPRHSGFVKDALIKTAEATVLKDNEVAILVNNTLMSENVSKEIPEIGSKILREVSIILEAKIAAGNYTYGSNVGFQVPIIFSVAVMPKPKPIL